MIFSILSVTCLAGMVLSLKQSSRMALFTVAPQKASSANGMARTLPIWTNRPLSGGTTGKLMTRACSVPKKSRRFQEWKCPHGGNFNNPYSGNAKRNAPNAVQKQPNRPDRSGVRHECAIPTILICAARVFTALEGMRQARDGALLIPVWIPQTICKACNASILMEQSVFSWAARYLEDNSSFRDSRKSSLLFARALPLVQASILPQAERSI